MLSIVVATDLNNGIGIRNTLPWHLSNDLKHFKSLTVGKPVLMGRKTFESIGKPLPNRRNMVISQSGFAHPGVEVFASIESALAACATEPEVMLIGGGQLYRALFDRVKKVYRTLVHTVVEADTFFPALDETVWKKESAIFNAKDEQHAFDYTFEIWQRV